MNRTDQMGRLARHPKVFRDNGTKAFVSFGLICSNQNQYDKNGKLRSEYIPCAAAGRNARLIENCAGKGSQIAVSGYLHTYQYRGSLHTEVAVMTLNLVDTIQQNTMYRRREGLPVTSGRSRSQRRPIQQKTWHRSYESKESSERDPKRPLKSSELTSLDKELNKASQSH